MRFVYKCSYQLSWCCRLYSSRIPATDEQSVWKRASDCRLLDRTLCRKIIRKVLVVTTATHYSRQTCSRRNRTGVSVKSAVQARVVLMIKPRLHATYTLYSLLLNYKLEAAGESWPNFLGTVIRKWGYCTVGSGIIATDR